MMYEEGIRVRFEVFTVVTMKNVVFWDVIRRVALVRTDVSEELSASIIRVTGIGGLACVGRIQSGSQTLVSVIHKLINPIWNKEEFSDQTKEYIIIPLNKTRDKTNYHNCRAISLLSTSYKILSNILLFIDEIIVDPHCGVRRNRSTTDQIFSIRQILEEDRQYNGTVHQLLVDFKKSYDSVRREVLYNILTEFRIPMQLVSPYR
jgi:hypothetical protein